VGVVVSFEDFVPPARYDEVPWTVAHLEESDDPLASPPVWTEIDSATLTPVDDDPANPVARSFTTVLGTAVNLWYRLVWEDGAAGTSDPTVPLQNGPDGLSPGYAGVDELARQLKIRTPSPEQRDALRRVIAAARLEIDSELDRPTDEALQPPYPALVVEVNYERAQELWQQSDATLGFIGLGAETGPARVAVNTWEKFAQKLAPLKLRYGLA
jgi:hypothetical protein